MDKPPQIVALEARCQLAQEIGKKLEEMKAETRAEFHRQSGLFDGLSRARECVQAVDGQLEGTKDYIALIDAPLVALSDAARTNGLMMTGKEAQCDAVLDVVESLFKASRDMIAALVSPPPAPAAVEPVPVTAADTMPAEARPEPYIPHLRKAAKSSPKKAKNAKKKAARKRASGTHPR